MVPISKRWASLWSTMAKIPLPLMLAMRTSLRLTPPTLNLMVCPGPRLILRLSRRSAVVAMGPPEIGLLDQSPFRIDYVLPLNGLNPSRERRRPARKGFLGTILAGAKSPA